MFVCVVKEELALALLKTTTGENLFLDRVYASPSLFSVFCFLFSWFHSWPYDPNNWNKGLLSRTQDPSSLSLSLSNQTICSCKEGDFDLQGKLLSADLIRSYPLISYGIWVNQGGSIFLPYTLILPFCFCTHNSILLLLV